jgi:hypothetical protein|tara:strand:- start:1958 stop:2335 length:378 start_codon:yes stop_codon:yes gene_type:complete
MSTIINGALQNQVDELNSLNSNLYENIFNVNLIDGDGSNLYFYNILNKVVFPDDISDEYITEIVINIDKPWTTLSYEIYGTIQLWWVIVLLNKPDYIFKAQAGINYKFIKPGFINAVLQQISNNQ